MLINEEQHYYYFMPTTLIVTDYKKNKYQASMEGY